MRGSGACLVVEELHCRPGTRDAVLAALGRLAGGMRTAEPGCLRVDIVEDAADPCRLLLYRLHLDPAAAEAHAATPHARVFDDSVRDLLESRHARRFRGEDGSGGRGRVLIATPMLPHDPALLGRLEEVGLRPRFNDLGRTLGEQELIERLDGVVASIAGIEPYTERVFAAAPQLRCVARFGVGWDQIDLEAASRHGVTVVMAFGSNHEAVADHAFALMAALANRVLEYDRRVRRGEWGTLRHRGLHGATVGIVGFGRIGRALARRCRGFATRVLVADPALDAETVRHLGCEPVDLDQLLREADFVSLHAPLGPETTHLMDARRLSLMRPTAYLVNTARGALIDEAALIEALRSGTIAGAGLDVFEVEPPVASPLLGLDNVVLTPHVAGLSEDAIRRMAEMCVDNVLHVLRGEDPGEGRILNPETFARHA